MNPQPEPNVTRLLAINFGGLGDEVLFLPTLQSIKSTHPSWHITLLTEPRGSGIKQVTNLIDSNIAFDIKKRPLKLVDYLHLIDLLRSGRYDIVLSTGASPQVAALLFLSGIRKRIGFGTNAVARLLLTDPVPLDRNQHASFMYHDLVKGLGINKPAVCPQIFVSQENIDRMHKFLTDTICGITGDNGINNRTVLIHPGTSLLAIRKGIIKNWSPDSWVFLIRRLLHEERLNVVLAGGPDDAETISEIEIRLHKIMGWELPAKGESTIWAKAAQSPGAAQTETTAGVFINAFGKTASLADLVALVDLCDVLICVDSAPMHVGVGLSKPLVALFGPTDPQKLLWAAPQFKALRDPEDAKFWAGKDPFMQPRGSHSAADEQTQPEPFVRIQPDIVFQTAMDLLNSASGPDSSRGSRRM